MEQRKTCHRNSRRCEVGPVTIHRRTTGPGIRRGLQWEPKTEGKVKMHIEHKYVHDDREQQRHQSDRTGKNVRNKGTTETEKDVY